MESKVDKNSKNSNLILFENDESVFDTNNSLQDNFQKFLKLRKSLRKSLSNNTNENENIIKNDSIIYNENFKSETLISFRDDPERMADLRKKFVDKAISYLGTPYARRYLDENHPLYHSPIFMDCCGLVRQCVNDLSEDFGFMLGRWNQAYQFDILPEKIDFSQLQVGDLIFYEATHYKEKKWKSQPHNLVHVEIFLGGINTPERTIAARDRFGFVEYNESYKFVSENYYDIKFYYRSINPWLRGINKNVCLIHRWHDDSLDKKANKFSLFNYDAEEEETLPKRENNLNI